MIPQLPAPDSHCNDRHGLDLTPGQGVLYLGTMIIRWPSIIAVLFLLAGIAPSRADLPYQVGLKASVATAPERGKAIDLTIWYPSQQDGSSERYGESKIFRGVSVWRNASFATGTYPLVILAHGGLRSNPALAGWLAADLAMRGRIVVQVHAPELSEADAAAAVAEVWLRPADLSAALSAVEADPALAAHLDPGKVGVVGFFLGGTSALAVAGAQLDADRYRQSCDEPGTDPDCRWYAKHGVDLHQVHAAAVSKSHLDSRIKVAIAVNPELSNSLAAESLAGIKISVQVIALGQPHPEYSVLREQIPAARLAVVSGAVPFSAFSPCTPKASIILAEEGEDDSICRDGGTRSREAIQAEIATIINAALLVGFGE